MSSVRTEVSLSLNGRPLTIGAADALLPLTDVLRRRHHLTGSKIVCAEGDCGACSVLVKRPDEPHPRTICGCIAMTAALDGCEITTVEGLGNSHQPSPVQQAFVAHHAAQCGFCTPGLVVTTTGAVSRGCGADRACMTRELVGNLCRCTGYTAILDAACSVDRASVRLPESASHRNGSPPVSLLIKSGERTFFQPVTELEAAAFKARHPEATPYGGGTDVGVAINKGRPAPGILLSTTALPGWRQATAAGETLTLGGAATLEALKHAAADAFPALAAYLERFASPQIRMAGTLAGNIATASPIGDTLPPLLALEAEVELISLGEGGAVSRRTVPLTQFFIAYRKTQLRANELISRITIPIHRDAWFYKISKRRDVDISSVSAAFVRTRGGALRIAFGGVAATPKRLTQTEAHLASKSLTPDLLDEAANIALTETTPLSDMRGSATYRQTLIRNLFHKFAHDAAEPDAAQPLATGGRS